MQKATTNICFGTAAKVRKTTDLRLVVLTLE